MKFYTIFFAFLTICQLSCQHSNSKIDVEPIEFVPYPVVSNVKNEAKVDYKHFTISYNTKHQNPNWVLYRLTRSNLLNRKAKRKNKFFTDPVLSSLGVESPAPYAFRGSDYDRGHMAPSADFLRDQDLNDLTFTMANISPQTSILNRGRWKKLEQRVREWTVIEEELIVITGPVLKRNLDKIPHTRISVPNCFYKILLSYKSNPKAIGFVLCQNDKKSNYIDFRVTNVDTIEKLTKVNFFSGMTGEAEIEKKSDPSLWRGARRAKKLYSEKTYNSYKGKIGMCFGHFQGCCSGHGGIYKENDIKMCSIVAPYSVICNDGTTSRGCEGSLYKNQ